MRIKEVEKATGLTAKAIRLYESKGLLSIARESENDYRDYSEADVERLRTIAVLRRLDAPVKSIKEWTDGNCTINEILSKVCEQSKQTNTESDARQKLAQGMLEALEKHPDASIPELVEELTELQQLVEDIELALRKQTIGGPIWMTLAAVGPVFMTIFGILDGAATDRILLGFVLSLICVVLTAFSWQRYFAAPKSDRENSGCFGTALFGVLTVMTMIGLLAGLTELQMWLFVPDDMMIVTVRQPWSWLIFVVELEIIGAFFLVRAKFWKRIKWNVKKILAVTLIAVVINGTAVYGFVTGVSVATEEGILRHSFFSPEGEVFSYDDIVSVETGFGKKLFGLPIKGTGEFYYRITYADGTIEDWSTCISDYDADSWLWMLRLDKRIMEAGAEKTSSDDCWEYCQMEQRYVNILLEVIRNK